MSEALLTSILEQLTSLNSNVEKNQNTLEELKKEFTNTKLKCDHLEKENASLKLHIKQLEIRSRKNNLIIFGLPKHNNTQDNINFLKSTLEIELELKDIDNSYPLGKNAKEPIPVKFEFVSQLKKIELLKNAYKLKNIKNIYIAEDLSKEDQEINKTLRQFLNKAKLAERKAKIRNNKLIVGGKVYTHEFLVQNPNIIFGENNTAQDVTSRVESEETSKRKGNFEEEPDDTSKKTRRNPQRKQQNGLN